MIRPPDRPAASPHESALAIRAAVGVALLSLLIYVFTLSPEVQPGDSAELALTAHELGVTHPPGYPLHTILGKAFGLLCGDPARATNLLSAVATAAAIGLTCLLGIRLSGSLSAGVRAAGILAVLPSIWKAAVVTEVYNVNLFFFALSLWLAIRWKDRPTLRRFVSASGALGLSLGTGLANTLLIPGFVILFFAVRPRRWLSGAIGAAVFVLCAGLILSWNYFRGGSYLPLGTQHTPDTFRGLFLYLAGAQFGTAMLPSPDFYFVRFAEHVGKVLASLVWIGALPVVLGAAALWQRSRATALALTAMLAGNFGYFTGHPWVDYREMVNPSYLLLCLALACGLAWMGRQKDRFWRTARTVVPVGIIALSLAIGLRRHPPRPVDRPLTRFVTESFRQFPPDAVAVCDWYKFAPMVYFQRVHGLRPDVTLVEGIRQPRRYSWGMVDDAWEFARETAPRRPVFLDFLPGDAPASPGDRPPAPPGWYAFTSQP